MTWRSMEVNHSKTLVSERFARELAKGLSQYVAYHVAGFTPNPRQCYTAECE